MHGIPWHDVDSSFGNEGLSRGPQRHASHGRTQIAFMTRFYDDEGLSNGPHMMCTGCESIESFGTLMD